MMWTTWQVYRRALDENADIYQFHDPELIPAALALRCLHSRNVIYDMHENVPQQIMGKQYIPAAIRSLIAKAYDGLERRVNRKMSAVVTANEDLNNRCSGAPRLLTVHNYADDTEFAALASADLERFRSGEVFCSAASDRTAFPEVLKAVTLLRSRGTAFRLLVSAVTNAEAALAACSASRAAIPEIKLLGVLPRPEMVRKLCGCAVSIVLYDCEQNHAGIRANRFFESLAAGAAIVAPDFPTWRQAIATIGCGLSVNPSDPEAIAAALEYLITNPTVAQEMGKRGRAAFKEMYSWTHERDSLLQLYRELADNDSNSRNTGVLTRR